MVTVNDLNEGIRVLSERIDRIPEIIETIENYRDNSTGSDSNADMLILDVLKQILYGQQVNTVGIMNLTRKQRDVAEQMGEK